jgi:hypothetical protein
VNAAFDTDQGEGRAAGAQDGPHKEPVMPEAAVPVVAAIVGLFAVFMVVVGGVSLWSNLPDRTPRD